jgi:hypothetical protein
MKKIPSLVTFCATLALAGCSTPEQRAPDHQRQLQEEAREKFEEQKDLARERAEEVADARRDSADDARKRSEDVSDARHRAAEDAARYRAYEEEYARQLGKKPSQLTSAERAWVREHF